MPAGKRCLSHTTDCTDFLDHDIMPRRLTRSLTLAAALTLGGGLAASCGLFLGVSHLEYDNIALAFSQRADERVAAVRQGMGQAFEVLAVTNQLFSRGEPVSRERFADFTLALLERHRFIQAFNFHRVVPGDGRAAIEAELQRVRPGTILTENTAAGLVPAPLRSRYHVIEYVEPMAGNEAAFGLNLSQNIAVMAALDLARSTGQPAASSLFPLAQAPNSLASFDLVQPVFGKDGVLRGNTAVVIRGQELVRESLAAAGLLDSRDIFVSVYASEHADAAALLLSTEIGRAHV